MIISHVIILLTRPKDNRTVDRPGNTHAAASSLGHELPYGQRQLRGASGLISPFRSLSHLYP